ncbi:MAG: ROK family protein [Chloroflexi bacterium]|nr:ROK family protein [Chloroflexota bacterium]
MTASDLALGIDIGGTKIAFALVNRAGRVLAENRIPTQPADGVRVTFDRIAGAARHLLEQAAQPFAGIGVGSPGIINPVTGVCQHAVNLGWADVPIRDELQRRLPLDVPILVHHDTNAGTVGEWVFGAARQEANFVYLAIGTGLGMGAVSDNRLLLGRGFTAMEFGHVSLDPNGRLCTCGTRGCGEIYISGVGLLAGYREHAPRFPDSSLAQQGNVTVNDIVTALYAGDPLALAIGEEAADKLTAITAYCVGTLSPGLFVIGGGLGLALYDWLLPRLESGVRARTLPGTHAQLRFARSQVTASAAGAAALVWQQ